HTVASNHVLPVYVAGPADITFTAGGKQQKLRIDVYNAYVFLPDPPASFHLEGLEQPGEAPERDARPELNPVPRDPPVKVPVTLLVDDVDPRTDKLWQTELRARFDDAAKLIEQATSVRFEFAGFATWKSDPAAKNTTDLLVSLEKGVRVKEGALAVGYSSRKIDEKVDPAFGQSRGLAGRHVLVREWRPKGEPERAEVLVHFLAKALGAAGTPDPGSALRAQLGNGYALRADAVVRLDPLNALLLNLWADERRRDPAVTFDTLSAANRVRIARLYKALLKSAPGDALALEYLNGLGRDVANNPEPAPKNPRPEGKPGERAELVRAVVKAVTARAKANAALGPKALSGDELTAAYVRTAAESALRTPGPEMVPAFLVALGIALDDTGALAADATTADGAKGAETPEERKERLSVLGNPTLDGRRDLCRQFFIGCATGELLPRDAAEGVAVGRALSDLHRPSNLCVPALAAEFAGITFARTAQRDAEVLHDVYKQFSAREYLPPLKGLRDCLSADKFEELYGGSADKRFQAVLDDIRTRLAAMKAYK
ncbi:MAG: hypothetical protein ACKODX_14550, partial [Gemmata sp.]